MDDSNPVQPDGACKQGDTGSNAVPLTETIKPDDTGRGVVVNQEEEARIKTAEAKNSTQPSQKDILDRIRSGERWMIFFTAIVALTTVAQVIQSACNNASTSKQVDRIIKAANTQACAAQKIANASDRNAGAAESFSHTAESQAQTLDKVGALQLKVAKINYSAFVELSPWMGLHRKGNILYAEIAVHVTGGKTRADNVQISGSMAFLPNKPINYDVAEFVSLNPHNLPAFDPTLPVWDPDTERKGKTETPGRRTVYMSRPVTKGEYPIYRNRKVYVWGKIRYKDFTGDWAPDAKFCRVAVAARIFDSVEGADGGLIASENCDERPH